MLICERELSRAVDALLDARLAIRARAWVAARRHLAEAATLLRHAAEWLSFDDPSPTGRHRRRVQRAHRIMDRLRARLPDVPVTPLCPTCRLWGQGACKLHQREFRQ